MFSLGADSPPAMATFLQRPRIGRWLLSLLGLVTAAAIFAAVLSTVADRLVDESSVDPALLDLALTQRGAGAGGMASVTPSTVTGKVVVRQHRPGRRRRHGRPVLVAATAPCRSPPRRPTTPARSRSAGCPPGATGCAISGAGFAEQWYQGVADVRRRHRHRRRRRGTPTVDRSRTSRSVGAPGPVGAGEVEVVADPTGAVARLVVPGVADPRAPTPSSTR